MYGDTTGVVIEESSAIPLIVYMLYVVLLVTSAHTFFGRDGYACTTYSATSSRQPNERVQETISTYQYSFIISTMMAGVFSSSSTLTGMNFDPSARIFRRFAVS